MQKYIFLAAGSEEENGDVKIIKEGRKDGL